MSGLVASFVAESQGQIGTVSVLISLHPVPETSEKLGRPQEGAYHAQEVGRKIQYRTEAPYTLHIEETNTDAIDSIILPVQVRSEQSGPIPFAQDHFSLRLRCDPISPAPPSLSIPHGHISFSYLSSAMPHTFICATCSSVILRDESSDTRYIALPSENWEELIDSWMCHGDQLLNQSVTRGKEGLDGPMGQNEVRVGEAYMIWPREKAREGSLVRDAKVSCNVKVTLRGERGLDQQEGRRRAFNLYRRARGSWGRRALRASLPTTPLAAPVATSGPYLRTAGSV